MGLRLEPNPAGWSVSYDLDKAINIKACAACRSCVRVQRRSLHCCPRAGMPASQALRWSLHGVARAGPDAAMHRYHLCLQGAARLDTRNHLPSIRPAACWTAGPHNCCPGGRIPGWSLQRSQHHSVARIWRSCRSHRERPTWAAADPATG